MGRPIPRSKSGVDVLGLTVVPVIAGFVLNEIAAVLCGFLSFLAVVLIWVANSPSPSFS